MKKVILLLLLILPVIIVAVSFAIAGFVGRAQMYIEIENVYVTDLDSFFMYRENGKIVYWHYTGNNRDDRFVLTGEVEGKYEFEKFITVSPARAKFSDLKFVVSNPLAVKVEGGRIHIMQNARSSDGKYVEIRVEYGEKLFLIVYVDIEIDNGRFDYFGFDYNALHLAVKAQDLEYVEVSVADRLIRIEKQGVPASDTIPLGEILNDGFDIAPSNLFSISFADRIGFLNKLEFEIKPGSIGYGKDILEIKEVTRHDKDDPTYFWKDYDAVIKGAGEVEITITADYAGSRYELKLKIIVL